MKRFEWLSSEGMDVTQERRNRGSLVPYRHTLTTRLVYILTMGWRDCIVLKFQTPGGLPSLEVDFCQNKHNDPKSGIYTVA